MAARGALGCHKPARATAAIARTASIEKTRMRRGSVVGTSGLDDQRALHRRVGAPATADVAIKHVLAGLIRRKGGVRRTLRRSDNTHPKLVDRPLVLATAVGMMRVVQARQPDCDCFSRLHADLGLAEAGHVGGGGG